MYHNQLSSNIWKLYLFEAIRSCSIFMPVIVLFFQEHGLNMKDVLLLQALFSVAVIVLEVPSGYFSDRFGRKNSIVIGSMFAFFGFGLYAISHGFWGFLAAEIVIGVAVSFLSGADTALLYDTLFELRRKAEYKKIQGRYDSIRYFSEGSAAIAGGFLALVSLRVPLYVESLFALMMIPLAFSLYEPERHKKISEEKHMLALVKYALHEHATIKWLIVYSSLISASTLTMVWFIQPYLTEAGLPLMFFGVAWAILHLSCSAFSFSASQIEAWLGKKLAFTSLFLAPVVAYFLLSASTSLWAAGFMLLFYFTRGVGNPILSDYLNGLLDADIRATILSVKNLVGRLIFSAIGPLIGWMNDAYSLSSALMLAGGIYLLLGCVSLFFMRKHRML